MLEAIAAPRRYRRLGVRAPPNGFVPKTSPTRGKCSLCFVLIPPNRDRDMGFVVRHSKTEWRKSKSLSTTKRWVDRDLMGCQKGRLSEGIVPFPVAALESELARFDLGLAVNGFPGFSNFYLLPMVSDPVHCWWHRFRGICSRPRTSIHSGNHVIPATK